MNADVRVAGVGMAQFVTPKAGKPYEELARRRSGRRSSDSGVRLGGRRSGLRLLRLRRLDLRPGGAVRRRHDRAPGRQREQQLLQWLLRPVPGQAGRRQRRRSTSPWRSGSSRCSRRPRRAVGGPHQPPRRGPSTGTTELHGHRAPTPRWPRSFFGAAGLAHMERVRHIRRDLREDRRQGATRTPRTTPTPSSATRDGRGGLASPQVYGPLTRLQCCPPTSGGAAVVLVSAEYAQANGLDGGGARSPGRRSRRTRRRPSPATCATSSATS